MHGHALRISPAMDRPAPRLDRPHPDTSPQAQAGCFVASSVNRFVDAIEAQISRWTAALHVFQIFMMGMAVVASAVFMTMSFLLVLAPISRMQQAMARVRQGELGTRVPVDSDDEFGQLAEGFNLMAHAM